MRDRRFRISAFLACALVGLPIADATASGEREIRREQVELNENTPSASIVGTIRGYDIVDYMVRAGAGQSLAVEFKPSNFSAYFNLLPPVGESALFVGSASGNQARIRLPADGEYTIRVYLMRSAARREEISNYLLEIKLTDAGIATEDKFERVLELQGIRFHVTATGEGSTNTLRIVPSGLEIDNSPMVRTIDGSVTGAELADLNVDGSPEIYVYITSTGSGSYGSLVGYSANRRKSLSEISLPPLADDARLSQGYMGHDEFTVVENVLARRFPLYGPKDTNVEPSGRMRQVQYKLYPGEAGWVLKVDRTVEY